MEDEFTLLMCVEPISEDVEVPFGEVTMKELLSVERADKFRIGTLSIPNEMKYMIDYNPTGRFIGTSDDTNGFLYEFKFDEVTNRETFINFLK